MLGVLSLGEISVEEASEILPGIVLALVALCVVWESLDVDMGSATCLTLGKEFAIS